MQQTILAIAGKPGLYKLVSRGNNNLIVEALDATHRRQPAFGSDRITSLGDIAMFTETDDIPLTVVLDSIKTLEKGKKVNIDIKKVSGDQLREYFAKVLPTFDRERVHTSDIKKLLQWYNILVENGITDFKEEEKTTESEEKEAEGEEKKTEGKEKNATKKAVRKKEEPAAKEEKKAAAPKNKTSTKAKSDDKAK